MNAPLREDRVPGVAAIASYLPARVLENQELVARHGFEPAFLEGKLGIRQRHIAGAEESVSDMAVAAAERLFTSAGIDRGQIGLLVLCTQNPDYRLPTTADLVQDRLKLPTTTAAFDINQGCSGYIYGLAVATSMMRANGIGAGLLITAEAYSKVMSEADRNTTPLFGDGAAAMLLLPDAPGRIGRFTFGSDGSGARDLIVRAGGSRHPAMACAGEGALHMNGRAIFNFMMRRVPADVAACLAANGLSGDDIDLFVFHQASRFMLETLAREMRVDLARVPVVMEQFGNTVSSTIPMAIEKLGGIAGLVGKRLLLSGFGVGLSWGSTVLYIER